MFSKLVLPSLQSQTIIELSLFNTDVLYTRIATPFQMLPLSVPSRVPGKISLSSLG